MSLETHGFEFDEFFLDTRERVLFRLGKPLSITPRVFQMLLVLVENHGRIVEKDKMMEIVWADSFVEESNLTFTMRQLRKALGDNRQNPRFVETVPRRGYRFIAEVRENLRGGREKMNPSPLDQIAGNHNFPANGGRSRMVFSSIFGVLGIVLLLTAVFFIRQGASESKKNPLPARSGSMDAGLKFETVNSADRPTAATISPDGKYIAYLNIVSGRQSLWLRQLSSGINRQIVGPENDTIFLHLEFSENGEYIYFTCRHQNEVVHLDRVSILGGTVKSGILTEVDGAFSISPDDRQISFRRYEQQKRLLLIAQTDGSDIRRLTETPKTFTDNVFSPDGKTIAFAAGQSDTGERDFGLYTIETNGGEVKPVTDFKWFHIRGIEWFPDRSGLLITARLKNDEPQQLWKVSLPGGEVQKITETQNDFVSISATRDLSRILLVQISLFSNLYEAESSAPDNARLLAPATEAVVWTPKGNLVYVSSTSGNDDLWRLEADQTSQKQLTTETSAEFDPCVSPDGRYIVFVSDRAGKNNLWRIDAGGGNPVQLTNGDGEQAPVFTADGQFVVYNSMPDARLWRVSINGGDPEIISEQRASHISLSPDGTRYAHFFRKNEQIAIVVKTFPGGGVLQEFALPEGYFAGRSLIWSRDGGSLIYSLEDSNSVGNLWQQSLKGGTPQKLTNFTANEIFYFDYSPDGSQLAFIRGSWNYDVVLVKGFSNEKTE